MTLSDPILAAAKRYESRAPERKEQLRQAKAQGVAAVEDPERIETRESLLAQAEAAGLERVWGSNDLFPMNYLEYGLEAGRAVCRIRIIDDTGVQLGFGTGWMVSPTLLITNNHVLASANYAQRSMADFNFEVDRGSAFRPIHTFALQPDKFFYTNTALDFTLVAVASTATNGTQLSEFGYLKLIPASGKALLKECLSIIQHPKGDAKHIALRSNELVDIFDNFAHYVTDTQPGSSGSPVFNDQWQVVALHHSGVPKRDNKGRMLAVGGRLWKEEMGEDAIDWVANEGVRISSIFVHLGDKPDWTDAERVLLTEMGVKM